jgi:hypothetical protein
MTTRGRGRAIGLADGLTVALLAFVILALVGILLVVLDAGEVTAQLRTLMGGYLLASLVVGLSFFSPLMVRAALVGAGGFVAGATPVVDGWDLVGAVGITDAWIGQSWTLVVLFPLLVAAGAVTLILRD